MPTISRSFAQTMVRVLVPATLAVLLFASCSTAAPSPTAAPVKPQATAAPAATTAPAAKAPVAATSAPIQPAAASSLPKIDMIVTQLPSFNESSAILIKSGGFDKKNGIDINFIPRPLDAAYNEYRAGQVKVYGSGSAISEAEHRAQGLKSQVLFGTFDYFGAILTTRDDIKSLKDLKGKTLMANTVSSNYQIFEWFLSKAGLDPQKDLTVQNADVGALMAAVMAGRADASELWEPSFSQALLDQGSKLKPVYFHQDWKTYTGMDIFPYLAVSAQEDWIQANKPLIPKLFQAYKDAQDFLDKNPDQAIDMMAKGAKGKVSQAALERMVQQGTFGFKVRKITDIEKETNQLLHTQVDIKVLNKMPDPGIYYSW